MNVTALKDLVNDLKETALLYGESLETGDSKTANEASNRAACLKKNLVSKGVNGTSALLKLLGDSNPWVRYASASLCLDIDPERAYVVLQTLQSEPRAIGAAAYTILRMWETGPLKD